MASTDPERQNDGALPEWKNRRAPDYAIRPGREQWACGTCGHDVWETHSLNLQECRACPGGTCQKQPAVGGFGPHAKTWHRFRCPECSHELVIGAEDQDPDLACPECGEAMHELMTATAPDGTVHQLNGTRTLCGQDAAGWSRAVTRLQQMGLVIFCPDCKAAAMH
jgi:DNA-directed RNA polymerase subunit RPC12/RpoP